MMVSLSDSTEDAQYGGNCTNKRRQLVPKKIDFPMATELVKTRSTSSPWNPATDPLYYTFDFLKQLNHSLNHMNSAIFVMCSNLLESLSEYRVQFISVNK
ncbi:hypothetical protein H1C71_013567 [Ictidomys tridecemlineatus]|nr:hypothetical protein H1C71_013567 [Ictidomys tridecemlineatus]